MSFYFTVGPASPALLGFERNLTYNLCPMLKRAGFHPRRVEDLPVRYLLPVVEEAWQLMSDLPDYFQEFNPENGWGDYQEALSFLQSLHAYLSDAPGDYVMRIT